MQYKLINKINEDYTALEQVLVNRGIKYEDIGKYFSCGNEVVNDPNSLGEGLLTRAAHCLLPHIAENDNCLIIVDSDCDGFTASALLINYLYTQFPVWTENHVHWFIHGGKQHGLSDCMDIAKDYPLVIIPDAGSNDFDYHKELTELGTDIIILDHHEVECEFNANEYTNAIVINNQTSNYPNKFFSGVGVTWQFCRYLDRYADTPTANTFLDLVALGNCGDMMSLLSLETKYLIQEGFKQENLKNPFIYYMAQKNAYKLGNTITPMGAAFYIVPFINATVRSGEQEEKEIIFQSMLTHKAFTMIPSTKRGHKLGEEENIVTQAVRNVTNIKNRQTRVQDESMAVLERKIAENNLLDHQVLLFLLEPGEVDRNVAGLIANKFMAKYQRPCCILTKVTDTTTAEDGHGNIIMKWDNVSYQGSARGCDKVGITEFKDICAATGYTMYEAGHQGAFGLGISADSVENFISATDEALKDMPSEPIYYVDYEYYNIDVNTNDILDIGAHPELWGKDIDEPLILIKNLKVTSDMVTIYKKTSNTLKITLPNGLSLMKFNLDENETDLFSDISGFIELNVVGYCRINEWNGNISPQLMIEDYEILDKAKYYF